NYNCSYCSVIHSEKVRWERTRYLSPEEWEEIWKKIYLRNGPCHLNITGGEPFVYPKFLEILRRILKYHTVGLQTNLSWDPEEFLAQIPLERVNICSSFHPEKVRLEEFIGSVKKLKDAGADISVNYVAFPPQLKELEKLVSESSLNGIMLTILPYTGQYEGRYYPKEYSKDERKLLKDIIKNYSLTDRHLLWWLKQDDDELFTGFSEARRPDQTEKFKSKEELPSPISKSSNTELHSFEEEYINNSEKFLDSRLCRMGEVYAIINPDGRAVRCCADLRGLGNIIDGSFNFSSQPLPCEDVTCRCFKAMILGSEDEWGLSWIATESERETDYLRLLNMPVEEYGEK
ncbi:MAG: radical SAM protein, partial [Elusimicrobia bacterium]|nr:radical SAM protein [Elusimicrobiota bacterium]